MELVSVPSSSPFWKFRRDPTNNPVEIKEDTNAIALQKPVPLWRRILSATNLPLEISCSRDHPGVIEFDDRCK